VQEDDGSGGPGAQGWSETRSHVIRDAVGLGLATGAYALSFGAIASAAGLSVLQTSTLSVLMFTGASQFALVGVLGAGGGPLAAAATAVLLGTRNALYGLRLSGLLGVSGLRRIVASHFVIDESTAMAIGRRTASAAQLGFWATGVSVFVGWNTGTILGAIGARALSSPKALGLDAAVPAAFLALVAPRLRSREPWAVALAAAAVALLSVSFVPAGVPVLLAALVAVAAGLRPTRGESVAGAAAGDRR
jgi:predicted branched-subunit amino acid permease